MKNKMLRGDDTFLQLYDFFEKELGLEPFDEKIFAIIFSFGKDGKEFSPYLGGAPYFGGYSYLMKRTGKSKSTVIRSLNYLEQRELIIKRTIKDNNNILRNYYLVNEDKVIEIRNEYSANDTQSNVAFQKRTHQKDLIDPIQIEHPPIQNEYTPLFKMNTTPIQNDMVYKIKEEDNFNKIKDNIDCEKQIFSPPLSIFSEKGTKIETPSETTEKTISLNTKKSHAQNSTRPDACLNTEKKAKEKKYADKHSLQKEFMEMYFEAHEKFKGIKPPQKDMGRIAKSLNELRLAIEEVVDRSYSEKGLLVDAELMKKKLGGFLLASYEKMDDFTKRQWDANYINSKFANIYAILVGAVPQKPTAKGFYQQSTPATFSELQDKQFQKDFLIAILKSINVIFYGSAVKGKTEGIRVGKETLTSNRQVIDKLNEDGFIVDNQFAQIIKQNLIDSNCEIDYNSTHIATFCSHYNIDIDSFKGGL